MKKEVETIIGVAYQNNSGGYYIQNSDVQSTVAVEGLDREDAERRFQEIISEYSSFCPCCGERWEELSFEGWPAPENGVTDENFRDAKEDEEFDCVVHYIDGAKKFCVYEGDN